MRLSIRWRLTLWNTLTLAAVLLGFGALVYALMARALYRRVDEGLLTEWRELYEEPVGDVSHGIEEAYEHHQVLCVVYDSRGVVRQLTDQLADADVPAPPESRPPGPRFETTTVPGLGRRRILTAPLRAPGQELTIRLIASLEAADHELGRLLAVLATAVPTALVAAGGLGYLMARRALAPVGQLNRLTAQITADRLDRRLPVTDAGDEFGQLTQTINAMIGRLERSFAEVRRFTADASHELRTPLTAIRAEAELALTRALTESDSRQLLGSVLEECERLTGLADQLLALSREDAGTSAPALDPVDVAAALASVVETMRPLAEAKDLQVFRCGPERLTIPGDEARLRQVFFNVLDNAIKYTPVGGRVEVRLERNNQSAVVRVVDTGIGIPPEHLPHVFERFYRVDGSRTRDRGGNGLGLSIARAIVTAHGGRIELESAPGCGTGCSITLPAEAKEGTWA
jgi:heavy metal sensor kinase